MRTIHWLLLLIPWACSKPAPSLTYDSEHLKIKQVGENSWVHLSYLNTESFGKVACNGLIYANEEGAFIFDTPSSQEATQELITFLEKRDIPIRGIVPTHFHHDCLGYLADFHQLGIPSYGHTLTIELSMAQGNPAPKHPFTQVRRLLLGKDSIMVRHFGAGHTVDNIVAYIPSNKVLFGGCLVKSMNAGKGNLEDADTIHWAEAIENIKAAYPNVKTVIPGHGREGGMELLDYTIAMFD